MYIKRKYLIVFLIAASIKIHLIIEDRKLKQRRFKNQLRCRHSWKINLIVIKLKIHHFLKIKKNRESRRQGLYLPQPMFSLRSFSKKGPAAIFVMVVRLVSVQSIHLTSF